MMLNLLSFISACFVTKNIIKEHLEPVAPATRRFDWDAYWDDIAKGMPPQKQLKKRQSGGYYTTEPETIKVSNKDNVIDVKRYEYHKKAYGLAVAEYNRKRGAYMYVITA